MASTSSSTPSDHDELNKEWEVFISFRGADVRQNFLSHFSKALAGKQIDAFVDEKLSKGEEITPTLLKIIEDSYISVVIFSENYAGSSWCLDELVKIDKCRKTEEQTVIPVFYHVDPTDVQELEGSFGKAFQELKKLEHNSDKVHRWHQALKGISNLSGWDSRNIKSEAELVEKVVKNVSKELSQRFPHDLHSDNNLVGINSRIEELKLLLQIDSVNDVRFIGIWGMGGIGKTTIANEVFSRIRDKFDSHYFVANVKEEIRKQTTRDLREEIICELLGETSLKIRTENLPDSIRGRLKRKRVLIIFDDVDDENHLKLLAGEHGLYKNGSRIVLTSRDRQVLLNHCHEEHIYKVAKLTDQEALRLFSLYAFKKEHPIEGYVELSKKVVDYCQGIALALRVLGSNLYGKEIEEWESELKKLKNIPDMKIQEVLKISYDGLGRHEKAIFLDIACFFKGEPRDEVERILEALGFFPKSGIRNLIDKSLVTIDWLHRLGMHDLLQQMGEEIVHEECKHPGGRSRLWNSEDIYRVLTTNTGTEHLEGISLEGNENRMELSSNVFMKMSNLRFLQFNRRIVSRNISFPDGLEYLPDQLRYLQWEQCPLKSLPLKVPPRNLVELHMPLNGLEELWGGDIKPIENLKVLNLSWSDGLIRIPES